MKATEVTAGLAESNGSLLPGLWRDSLHVTCGLTACTPGSAPGPTLDNEYGKTLPLPLPPEGSTLNLEIPEFYCNRWDDESMRNGPIQRRECELHYSD